jgi:hypothetical protein
MRRLWTDLLLYRRLALEATAWSSTFSFEQTADVMRAAVQAALPGGVTKSDASE